jgi:ATP-binding cassette subfamily B protein
MRNNSAAIRFEDVSFSYGGSKGALRGVSFDIQPGERVALVGSSGGGKSTILAMLLRLHDPDEGRVLIDGRDIRDFKVDSLRHQISMVLQDSVLFAVSIRDNIAYGNLQAGANEVEQAASLANAHEFIIALPEGYDTVVGERGLKLSGGEKQRVAIARAILKQPRILVFDEATSSLDSHSEQLILEALREVVANHTTLAIAHRLSTITDADNILVMDAGRIVEQGTHQQLLAHAGFYANMWALQQEERQQELLAEAELAP